MLNLEKRIAALESSASDDTLKIILVEVGESSDDARLREGISMNDPRKAIVICFD